MTTTRVTGIGGIFFKAHDPEALAAWYRTHLGIDVQPWGGAKFPWQREQGYPDGGSTAWSVFPETTGYFAPSKAPFMINYRVDDLEAVLAALRREGCDVDEKTDSSAYGRFGWVMDPEGNRVELWEPPAKKPA